MFHPSSFLFIVGLFAFIGAIGLAFFVAYRSATFVECISSAFLGVVATLALLSALPGSIVAVHDPDTNGEVIVYGPLLTRWATPEAALGDSNEFFFERVAVVPDQPTAGPRYLGDPTPPRQKPTPVSGRPFACLLVGLAASAAGLGALAWRLNSGKTFRETRPWFAVVACGLVFAIFGLATS
jgi:hypothetical protein